MAEIIGSMSFTPLACSATIDLENRPESFVSEIIVVFPLYQGVTQLDVTGPLQVFARTPGIKPILASIGGAPVSVEGFQFAGLAALEDITVCDVLCVPGGDAAAAIQDDTFFCQVRRLALSARYLTSVCTGSLVVAAAGLLDGRRAACHWAWRGMLALFGAIPDSGRVVRDGQIITGGGVTAGIDFALTMVAELTDAATAQAVQLSLEYSPEPPFDAGRPETATNEVSERVRESIAARTLQQRATLQRFAIERKRSVV